MQTVLITGDIFLGSNLTDAVTPEIMFGDLLPLVKKAGLAITNLEAPVSKMKKAIPKTGPALYHSFEALAAISRAGFDLVTLANNHIMDFGPEGLETTIAACEAVRLQHTGAGLNNVQASSTFHTNLGDTSVAIINIAENEFSTTHGDLPGAHRLNPIENYNQIREAKANYDFVFVIVHGGHERYQLPSPRMKSTYRFFATIGADAVIGHHTHCFSGYEVFNDTPIFYGLGNFLFKWNSLCERSWYEGFSVLFSLDDKRMRFEVVPHIQDCTRTAVSRLEESENEAFGKKLDELNAVIQNDQLLEESFSAYCKKVMRSYRSYLEPHSNRIVHALQSREILPSFLSKRKKALLLNIIRCEAHRDVVIELLTDEIRDSSKW